MKNSKNLQSLTPLKNYTPPTLPTLDSANPELLQKLPRRWHKISRNAAALACMGVMGMAAFSGCASEVSANSVSRPSDYGILPPGNVFFGEPPLHHGGFGGPPHYVVYPTEDENRTRPESALAAYAIARARLETADLDVRAHWGGSGSGPWYVAYITEQEAFAFIHAKLEAAGFNFTAPSPAQSVEVEDLFRWNPEIVTTELYDAQKGIAIAHVSTGGGRSLANQATEAFADKNKRVGVFYNPGENVFDSEYFWSNLWERFRDPNYDHQDELNQAVAERETDLRAALIESLTNQTQEFIDSINEEQNAIRVTLNGIPLEFDVAPRIVDGRTLVPMRAIFEALGMEVYWQQGRTIATKGNQRIEITPDNRVAWINHNRVEMDVPPQLIAGRTLVPLRTIAEATGADVEWNGETRTVIITT